MCVCRDHKTHRSLGYAYVNYLNPIDSTRALDALNFTLVNNKPIRVMYSNRDPSMRNSGANLFIKNLDKDIDNKVLYDIFSNFGTILSCKVSTDPSGLSKGYGFVQYDNEDSAQTAINNLNGMHINDKPIFVGPFMCKQDRDKNNVFVKNFADTTTEEDLRDIFGHYGNITSVVVMTDEEGKSRCFGFVNFQNYKDAAKAIEGLNGKKFGDKEWYVGKAHKQTERKMELKERFEQNQGFNLYLKNLDDSISDEKLTELFSEYGTITSCKVMRHQNGISKGFGFVAFSTAEEASKALNEMNRKLISGKQLYVAVAQRKEERKAHLQQQLSQMRPVAMYSPGAPICAATQCKEERRAHLQKSMPPVCQQKPPGNNGTIISPTGNNGGNYQNVLTVVNRDVACNTRNRGFIVTQSENTEGNYTNKGTVINKPGNRIVSVNYFL